MSSPLDTVDQDSDDAGVGGGAAQTAHCSARQDRPGWGTALEPVSERQHSKTGWTGGNH